MDASAADGLGAGCSAAWGRPDAGIETAKVLPSPLNDDDMFLDLIAHAKGAGMGVWVSQNGDLTCRWVTDYSTD